MHFLEQMLGDVALVIMFAILGIVGVIVFFVWLMKKAIDQG
jgi:flagellar biogenesis protein FliO